MGTESFNSTFPARKGRQTSNDSTQAIDQHVGASPQGLAESSVDRHGSLANVSLIVDLSNKEFGDFGPRNDQSEALERVL
jgi:hypothetical protein